MLGRAVMANPWILHNADRLYFGDTQPPLVESPEDILLRLRPYIERHLANGGALHEVTRHMVELYYGRPGARQFRRFLTESTCGPARKIATFDVINAAILMMEEQKQRVQDWDAAKRGL